MSDVSPIILIQYIIPRRTPHFKVKRGALTLPIGGAGAFAAPITKYRRFFSLHRASPISRVKIAAPVELAQGKEHEKIGEAGKLFRRTLLAYWSRNSPVNIAVLTGNRNVFCTGVGLYLWKKMSSAAVPGQ